jgi:hypothetical protein
MKDVIEKGNKQLAIVITIWSTVFAIPLFFVNENYLTSYVVFWLIIVNIGVLLSPKICKLIWK